jgi:Na+/H+ antiporter NhaD/arsenite permease-like protein
MYAWINSAQHAIIGSPVTIVGLVILYEILVFILLWLSSRRKNQPKSSSDAPGLSRIEYAAYYNLLYFVVAAIGALLHFFPTRSTLLPPFDTPVMIIALILQARRLKNAGIPVGGY